MSFLLHYQHYLYSLSKPLHQNVHSALVCMEFTHTEWPENPVLLCFTNKEHVICQTKLTGLLCSNKGRVMMPCML
jgi:hypothetical protein